MGTLSACSSTLSRGALLRRFAYEQRLWPRRMVSSWCNLRDSPLRWNSELERRVIFVRKKSININRPRILAEGRKNSVIVENKK